MASIYPEPQEVGIRIPPQLIAERYCAGFRHALKGGQIRRVEHLRRSFREGFRAGKLYLREVRRLRGVLTFPVQGRLRLKTVYS